MENYNSTDNELARQLNAGNRAAFTEIYNRYFPMLYVFAKKKLDDEDEVRDLLQELFATLWHKRFDFNTQNLTGYLYTAVRNRLLDRFAHEKVKNIYLQSFESFLSTPHDLTEHLVREKELRSAIESAIDELPPRMRDVFINSRRIKLSHKEIADKLNLTEQTVSKHISNALKLIRNKLALLFIAFWAVHYFFSR